MDHVRRDSGIVQSTIVSVLRMRAEHQPDMVAYTFVSHCGEDDVTYAGLDRRAAAVGCMLSDLGMAGKPVLLLYPPGIDYVAAFFGCLYAGAIAVPAGPPDPSRLDRSVSRITAIIRNAAPSVALTSTAMSQTLLPSLPGSSSGLPALRMVATDDISVDQSAAREPASSEAETVALLQYTSGSTGIPKGVVLTHRNLMSSSELVFRLFRHSTESRWMSWLPAYQYTGLIGGIVQPLYGGFPGMLMAPADVLRHPLRWLEEISRTRATTSGGPNFIYDLCVRQTTPEERQRLDLSCWQVAFNSAEPMRAETMERFSQAFAAAGFRRDAFHPCYGLAEATLIVTGGVPWSRSSTSPFDAASLQQGTAVPERPGRRSSRLVPCGEVSGDLRRVVIVDRKTEVECPAGRIGEIWISGPTVARSYWHRPEQTQRTFGARLGDTGEDAFLRSGDLGFVLDGQLFVTGRVGGAEPSVAASTTAPHSSGSHGQHRSLWFLREIAPGTDDHSTAFALRYRGRLDVAALEYALGVLMARQGIFRIADGTREWLEEHDAGDLSDAQLTEWLENAAQDTSDPAKDPLCRVRLYRRASKETVVLVVAHHSIVDFWSITEFVREFEELYAEHTGGQSAPPPELTDFVRHYWWIGGSRVSTHAALSSEGSHHKVGGQASRPPLPHR